jgi:hypothetical protein
MHRTLEHELRVLRSLDDEAHNGQRGSRLAKWIRSTENARKATGVNFPAELEMLGISWDILGIFQTSPEQSRNIQKYPEQSRIIQNVQKLFRSFKIFSGIFRACPTLLEAPDSCYMLLSI